VALADSPSLLFQQMVLNVVSVRFNPSTDVTISENDKKWETISPPPPSSGMGPNEAIIDLNSLAIVAQVFNTGLLQIKTFGQVEVVLDPIAPGSVVPVCSPVVPGEGCISYPMNVPTGTKLRLRLTPPLSVKNNQLSILVLDITPTIVSFPADSNGSFTINPTMTVASANNFLATVSGKVVKAVPKEKITAEIAGTDQVVTTVSTESKGTFTIGLPAVAGGTAYDLIASGQGTSFFPLTNEVFTPGTTSLADLTPSRPHGGATLTGTVVDKCTGVGIEGVTLDVLTPAANAVGPNCTTTPPTGCVVVATGTSTAGGSYSVLNPATGSQFSAIPAGKGTNYRLRISASGYDSLNTSIDSTTTNLKCPNSGATDKKCDFSLTRGQINGNVRLTATNTGAPLDVLIMAEQSNTNNIAAVTTVTIPTGSILAPFTLLVPTNQTVATTLDLFASAEDLFGGKPEQATGHTIAVLSPVTPPAVGTACTTPTLVSDLGPMNCVGHGSVSGTASTFDQNTTIVLSSGGGVQLMQSKVGAGGAYNFCAPKDTYNLQRFESGIPVAVPTTITLTPPSLIPTPCSSICDTGIPNIAPPGGDECFLCANTPGIVVP
jgi:hypothetical protein